MLGTVFAVWLFSLAVTFSAFEESDPLTQQLRRCPMMLAFAEIRRARGRFISIIGALALITFLVLTLSALSDGLFYGSTGAYRSSNANGYAFSSDAEGSLIRSRYPSLTSRSTSRFPESRKHPGSASSFHPGPDQTVNSTSQSSGSNQAAQVYQRR